MSEHSAPGRMSKSWAAVADLPCITASDAEIDKAEGVNVNLWTGLGMLGLGAFFLAWLWLRPVDAQRLAEEDPE